MNLPCITPPVFVQTALQMLHAAGYEAYVVGGCVRDALLGAEPHDWDVTTNAKPDAVVQLFSAYHVIETGLQHGTVTVVIEHCPIEITTYRIDGVYADYRRPETVSFTQSLDADLARRDFTVNAMAYQPETGVVDLYGGRADLAARRIACVGCATDRFEEDGLRILRALRFASVLDFTIAPETAAAIHTQKTLLLHISAERIWVELTKLLCGQAAERILQDYADVLFTILPELEPMYGFDQCNPHHCYDVYTHTLKVVMGVPAEPLLRWAALLHDAGKPACFTIDERGGHFYGHAVQSVAIAKIVLKRLKSDRKTYDSVLALVECHDTVWSSSDRQLKRLVGKIGLAQARNLILLHRADVGAQAEIHRAERVAHANQMLAWLDEWERQDACMSLKKLAVGGKDLMAIGIPQGKQIGICLQMLLEQVIDEQLCNERDELLAAAKEWKENAG